MNTSQARTKIPAELVSGKKLSDLFDSGRIREGLKAMPRETLEFAADEQNNTSLVESILKSLKTTEPDKANIEYAAKIVEVMGRIAKNVLEEG